MKLLLAIIAMLAATPASAETLKCEFVQGVFRAWGEPTKITTDKLTLIFDSIDEKAGRARLIGNAGSSNVTVLATVDHLSFLEVTKSGNVNLTTLYKSAAPIKAVHPRHTGRVVDPTLSQMYGTCVPFD